MNACLLPSPFDRFALAAVLLLARASWGFVPHRALHSVAWNLLPAETRDAWGDAESMLHEWAVAADRRKHTDSLEAPRHYLDVDLLDTLTGERHPWEWGKRWDMVQARRDSLPYPKDPGSLPWQIHASYHLLVWSLKDSVKCDSTARRSIKLAADLGHYIADAHVPLHSTSNYDGQLTNQRGTQALWETHAMEWLLQSVDRAPCSCVNWDDERGFDPHWLPWQMVDESHQMVDDVLAAERRWKERMPDDAWGFRRRGRTMQLIPTPDALQLWDSLTHHSTNERYCLAAQRIALAWHGAWMDAGSPNLRLASQGAEPYLEALIRRAGHWARSLVGQRPSETLHREP